MSKGKWEVVGNTTGFVYGTGATRTEQWMKENGITEAKAKNAGLTGQQQHDRAKKAISILKAAGHENTEMCQMLIAKHGE